MAPAAQAVVEQTLVSLGYELVEIEHAPRGLLRVYIDAPNGIRIEDCEAVSRQLTRVLEVEGIDYDRLEVSSPGLDRPLNKAADFVRFSGSPVTLRLRLPLNGQRNFEGVLQIQDAGDDGQPRFGLQFEGRDGPALLGFRLDEVERVRLKPVIDFRKGGRQ